MPRRNRGLCRERKLYGSIWCSEVFLLFASQREGVLVGYEAHEKSGSTRFIGNSNSRFSKNYCMITNLAAYLVCLKIFTTTQPPLCPG